MVSKGLIFILICFDLWRDIWVRQDVSGFTSIGGVQAVKPILDLANNMRMVLVPGKKSANNKKFLILKLVLLWFSEEIVSLWTSLSAGALDCVLLVTSIGRYSVDEVKMVEFVANHLFEKEGLLRERILIVITRSEPYLVENKTEAVKWLERESENDVFKHYLNLVDHDTNRIIFVDNRDVTRETDNFEKIRLLQNNHKMAQKVLDPIH